MRVLHCLQQFLKSLFRRKSLQKEQCLDTPLRRCLTLPHLIMYSIAHMAGAGIYVLTGKLIRDQAGPAASISYILAAISAFFTGLCYAEFSTMIPKTGSSYTYTYIMLGEVPAFIIGWTTISDMLVGMASVAKAFSGTIDLLAHGAISNWTATHLYHLSGNSTEYLDSSPDILAFTFLVILILLTITGAHFSLTVNGVLTVLQVVCLLVVSIGCFIYGDLKKAWSAEEGGFAPFGLNGIIEGASIAVFAFSGFESLANASEEMADPKKSLPRALFSSLLITTLLYLLASFGLSVVVPKESLDYKSPFVAAFHDLGHPAFMWIAAAGTLLATGATKISSMFVVPRMFYAIASDGLIFRWLGHVEKHTRVPIMALLVSGTLTCLLALFFNIQTLADFTTLGILFSYFIIGVDLFVLRYLHSEPHKAIQRGHQMTSFPTEVSQVDEEGEDELHHQSTSTPPVILSGRPCLSGLFFRYSFLKSQRTFIVALVLHLISSLVFSILVDYYLVGANGWVWAWLALSAAVFLATFALLACYQPRDAYGGDGFKTPWMPLAPSLTILVNVVLIVRLPALTWVRFLVWTLFGLLIYATYGYWHSMVRSGAVRTPPRSRRRRRHSDPSNDSYEADDDRERLLNLCGFDANEELEISLENNTTPTQEAGESHENHDHDDDNAAGTAGRGN